MGWVAKSGGGEGGARRSYLRRGMGSKGQGNCICHFGVGYWRGGKWVGLCAGVLPAFGVVGGIGGVESGDVDGGRCRR